MVIKYFLLITIIYKSIEIKMSTECEGNQVYDYFILDCRELDGQKKSPIFNNIICEDGKYYDINSTNNQIDCFVCPENTNSTPDGYYCTENKVTGNNCSLCNYYDHFYGIKQNINCSEKCESENGISNKKLQNLQENNNNINLRKMYTVCLEEENKYISENIYSSLLDKSITIDNNCSNNTTCQYIANLCVLKMYDNNDEICKIFINDFSNNTIPQIYFDPTNNENNIFNRTMIRSFSYNTDYRDVTNIYFSLFIRKIYFNGTVSPKLEELTNQFMLCSQTYEDGNDYRHFGVVIDNNCEIDLERFNNENETIFYEMYVDDNGTLIEVPILIDNINNPNSSNSTFSDTQIYLNNGTNHSNWILVKRFFLFEKVINSNYITYAKFMKFRVNMTRKGSNATVTVPIFEIFYSTKQLGSEVSSHVSYVSFQSEYYTEMKHYMGVMLGLLIAACVLVFIIVIYRVWVWIKLNPKILLPDSWFIDLLITIIFTLFRFFGIFMFWFTLIISAYWYFFYKLQSRIYLFIPPLRLYSKYYEKFDIIFGLGCSTYILYMIYRIYRQVSFSIFFIDWEQEKEIFKNANTSDDIAVASKYRRYRGAWRMLHVANQFNALQSKRVISLYFSFCWFILLYYKCKWSYRESQVPTTKRHENSPVNFIIRHFLSSIIIIGSGAIQMIVVRFLQLWIPLKKQEFLDLCSVSNISVFILDEKLHGYYIHGQAPFGKADANLDELLRFLDEERKGKVRARGFAGAEEDSQSYEMYISYAMRVIYDGLYYIQNEAFYAQNQPNLQKVIDERKLGMIYKYIPDVAKKGNLDYLSTYMNSVLKNKIENVSSNAGVYIKEKNMIERILCYPPDNVEIRNFNTQDIILYKDPNLSFDDILFTGMEWEWFVMDVYLFQFWTRILDNTEIAIFLTYVIDYALAFIRKFFGEKNVAKKAVIDERFFS